MKKNTIKIWETPKYIKIKRVDKEDPTRATVLEIDKGHPKMMEHLNGVIFGWLQSDVKCA